MGNSASKEKERPSGSRQGNTARPALSSSLQPASSDQSQHLPAVRVSSRAGSRHDLSIFHIGRGAAERIAENSSDRPRETKQEREARRVEKERQLRLKERERSMREEHVDGGFLVTVGTYTGPEDFNKAVVRQLMIERRLAPFWKGLNDHNDSWTEAQLFAAARGLPIPAPDEVPPEMERAVSQTSNADVNSLTVPITSRSQSYQSDHSANLSASHPAFSNSLSGPSSPSNPSMSTFRGRAKTLASLASGHKSPSADITPQEVRLPNDPYVNGQQLEVYLYKDAAECPICFLYYPPYLNRTRCCDQAICSECFVQIKRPDPHPPEHEQPGQPRPPEEEVDLLVSEVAACPFCVTPEFGVTYEPPPFRRGLAYAGSNSLRHFGASAMSSSTSLHSSSSPAAGGLHRRRGTSLSATSSNVVTTDRVRPDWAKKLADARANALRRSAAATALHNAAYVLGNQGDAAAAAAVRTSLIGRSRRRGLFAVESPGQSGSVTPREGESSSTPDLHHPRTSSRRVVPQRMEDLEELMMMEAIRQSLAAEEERKKKEEKEERKEEKKKKKEEKKAARKGGSSGGSGKTGGGAGGGGLYLTGTNESRASSGAWTGSEMVREGSDLGLGAAAAKGQVAPITMTTTTTAHVGMEGSKGKQPALEVADVGPQAMAGEEVGGGGASPASSPLETNSSAAPTLPASSSAAAATTTTSTTTTTTGSEPGTRGAQQEPPPPRPLEPSSSPTSSSSPQKHLETSRKGLSTAPPSSSLPSSSSSSSSSLQHGGGGAGGGGAGGAAAGLLSMAHTLPPRQHVRQLSSLSRAWNGGDEADGEDGEGGREREGEGKEHGRGSGEDGRGGGVEV